MRTKRITKDYGIKYQQEEKCQYRVSPIVRESSRHAVNGTAALKSNHKFINRRFLS
jgi:hypothetical protein